MLVINHFLKMTIAYDKSHTSILSETTEYNISTNPTPHFNHVDLTLDNLVSVVRTDYFLQYYKNTMKKILITDV